jgi:hypothetical protein
MKVSVYFHTYIRSNGPTHQKCMLCGAIHLVNEHNHITLWRAGEPLAKLSQEYPFPECIPYRVGAYRVRYSNNNWSKGLVTWDGERFHNGPIVFQTGSIIAWQGLAGDLEHTKKMPYELMAPLPLATEDTCD